MHLSKLFIILVGAIAVFQTSAAEPKIRQSQKSDDPRIQQLIDENARLTKEKAAHEALMASRVRAGIKNTKTDADIQRSCMQKIWNNNQAIERIKMESTGRSGPPTPDKPSSFSAPPAVFVPATNAPSKAGADKTPPPAAH